MKEVSGIVLAAGKGKRMNSKNKNKVVLDINGKPMILRTIDTLHKSGIGSIVVVVGFAKGSILDVLDKDIIIAEQREQLGTGDAVKVGLGSVPKNCKDVLIIYGDDAFMHTSNIFKELYKVHKETNATITFITMDIDDPTGLGRVIRDKRGEIVGIVEEKNADAYQRKLREVNLGCYIINKDYLKRNISQIRKNELSSEYYITDIIDIIASKNKKITSYKLKTKKWRGVNTIKDLKEAEAIAKSL